MGTIGMSLGETVDLLDGIVPDGTTRWDLTLWVNRETFKRLKKQDTIGGPFVLMSKRGEKGNIHVLVDKTER